MIGTALVACIHAAANASRADHVSILAIALDCKRFDGGAVTVAGAIEVQPESSLICPTAEFLDADALNCLWLELEESVLQRLKQLGRGSYLVVDGIVDCGNQGPLALAGGTIHKVTFIIDEASSEVLVDTSTADVKHGSEDERGESAAGSAGEASAAPSCPSATATSPTP